MKLSKIRILNYKSIKDVVLEIKKIENSYTTILVGRNETGKSNLLEAISFFAENNVKEYDYNSLKNAQNDKGENISFYSTYYFDDVNEWKDVLANKIYINEDLLSTIVISGIEKHIYLSKDSTKLKSKINVIMNKIQEGILKKFCYKETCNSKDCMYEIIAEKELSKLEDGTEYKNLNSESLHNILANAFFDSLERNKPVVSKWTYSSEYLITKTVNLEEFKNNNDLCLPLKNIFKLANIKTKDEIKNTIETLLDSPKNINRLEKILENAATEYILKIWPESNVIFKFKIQNNLQLSVYVFDEADDVNSFYMTDRSDGFKQFISLILSISAENNNSSLKNNLILIDEPEIHMHPSGIKYMKDELLRIGRNNYVFVATHSEFMIDSKNKERHYIITKKENNTYVKNWDSNTDVPNDEILRQAFGLDLLHDILGKYREKNDNLENEIILDKALMSLYPDFFLSSEEAKDIVNYNAACDDEECDKEKRHATSLGEFKFIVVNKLKKVMDNTIKCLNL